MNAYEDPALRASGLIRRSIAHNEIVFTGADPALEAELELAAEGEALDGAQWRVHLRTRSQD